jgi:hypothetical protein
MAWGYRKPEVNDGHSCLQASYTPRPLALGRSTSRCNKDEFCTFGTVMFIGSSTRQEGRELSQPVKIAVPEILVGLRQGDAGDSADDNHQQRRRTPRDQ